MNVCTPSLEYFQIVTPSISCWVNMMKLAIFSMETISLMLMSARFGVGSNRISDEQSNTSRNCSVLSRSLLAKGFEGQPHLKPLKWR